MNIYVNSSYLSSVRSESSAGRGEGGAPWHTHVVPVHVRFTDNLPQLISVFAFKTWFQRECVIFSPTDVAHCIVEDRFDQLMPSVLLPLRSSMLSFPQFFFQVCWLWLDSVTCRSHQICSEDVNMFYEILQADMQCCWDILQHNNLFILLSI